MKTSLFSKIITTTLLAILMSACQNSEHLQDLSRYRESINATSKGEFCTGTPKVTGLVTKFLFIVDESGSNNTTDPRKKFRADNIEKFIQKYKHNEFYRWGFAIFSGPAGDSAMSYISDPNNPNLIFSDQVSDALSALDRFRKDSDNGSTPYGAALDFAITKIDADIHYYTDEEATYNVIFLSDGEPTDVDEAGAIDKVKSLIKVKASAIHFSTIYYGGKNASASSLMSEMAKEGFGKFFDASTEGQGSLNIDDLISTGVSSEPYRIRRLVVYNMNAAPCADGQMGADSDSDGICDVDEGALSETYKDIIPKAYPGKTKFDSTNRNSFNPKYNDLFVLRQLQAMAASGSSAGNTLPVCLKPEASQVGDLLNSCEKQFLFNQNPDGITAAWTATMSQHGDPNNFDSDGDGIIDGVSFMFFGTKSAPLSFLNFHQTSAGANGRTNGDLLLNHLHPYKSDSSLPYNGMLQELQIRTSTGSFCYKYTQENLPLYPVQEVNVTQVSNNLGLAHSSNENSILVYYIQHPENNPSGKGILMSHFQKFRIDRDGAKDIQLDEGVFTRYKPR